ncbi:MAG: hypothetical protein WC593_06585 [Methanoregula sp.]
MTASDSLLQPNGLKLILAVTLLLPLFVVVVLLFMLTDIDILILVVITLVVSYLAACLIDSLVDNRNVKIAIASIAALITLGLGYLIVRSMTVICDPVHDPGGIICDPVHIPDTTPAPTVIATVQPTATTPMICDPVHEPGSIGPGYGVTPGIATGIVAQKLNECRKKCEE